MSKISDERLDELIERCRKAENDADGYVPHVHQDGARFHVLSWGGYYDDKGDLRGERYCSHPKCIVNKEAHLRLAIQSKDISDAK